MNQPPAAAISHSGNQAYFKQAESELLFQLYVFLGEGGGATPGPRLLFRFKTRRNVRPNKYELKAPTLSKSTPHGIGSVKPFSGFRPQRLFVCTAKRGSALLAAAAAAARRWTVDGGRLIEMNAGDVPVQNIPRYSIFTVLIHQDKKRLYSLAPAGKCCLVKS